MGILLLLIFIPIFWFLIIRPQQQQRRAHQEVVASLAPGQRVLTVGGLIGVLVEVDEDTVVVDPGDGSRLTFGRTFVRQRMPGAGDAGELAGDGSASASGLPAVDPPADDPSASSGDRSDLAAGASPDPTSHPDLDPAADPVATDDPTEGAA